MTKIVVITGASSGFGALTARALADAGPHRLRRHARHRRPQRAGRRRGRRATRRARRATCAVELDVADQESVDAAVARIIAEQGRLDVVDPQRRAHGPSAPPRPSPPSSSPSIYDTNVLCTQRVNRAALPHLRGQRDGLLVWVARRAPAAAPRRTSAPYFAAKAAEDSLAVSYAAELARFGIDTSIVVPGSFTTGTNHFAHAGHAADTAVAEEYEQRLRRPHGRWSRGKRGADAAGRGRGRGRAGRSPASSDLPKGRRPFRVHIDPAQDGAEEVFRVGDRIRREFYRAVGYEDLLAPAAQS